MNITFIGLGIMGNRMAKNLLKNSVPVTVFNRSQDPMRELENDGAAVATSYRDAVKHADVVFTMVSSPSVIKEIALNDDGFLAAMPQGALWIDCTTVNPSFSRDAHAMAQQYGVRFIDAPVTGTKPAAEKGELVFFVGGAKKDLGEIEHLLNFMGSKILHLGEVGQGAAFKMLNNALGAQAMLAFSEIFLLGEKLGFSKDFLFDNLPGLPMVAPFIKTKAEMMRANDDDIQFPLELMHKDLHLVAQTAYENNQPTQLVNCAKEIYAAAKQVGFGRDDFSAIYKFLSSLENRI